MGHQVILTLLEVSYALLHSARVARYEEAEGRLSNALRAPPAHTARTVESAADVAQRFVALLEVTRLSWAHSYSQSFCCIFRHSHTIRSMSGLILQGGIWRPHLHGVVRFLHTDGCRLPKL